MMQLNIQVTGDAAERIRELASEQLATSRDKMVQDASIASLQAIITATPVDTARTRSAWVQALEQLGGTPPAGWEGPHPTEAEAGRRQGQLSRTSGDSQSSVVATNSVSYVNYLEYGTSRRAPFAMVRRGLQNVKSLVALMFRL
ncbi:hypothetical protein [Planctomicrobium sp. SH527]|uniref:hypothetical protein n=1 Tax=Planctomicrobium sp. SH527 TaxID=3448123 RepID=UPI003F5BA35B